MVPSWIVQAYGTPEGNPLVLLHGFMQDATVWEPVAEALAVERYIAAPTMEPVEQGAASLEDLSEGVLGVVQQALIHTRAEKVVLAGYSLGGRVALTFARKYADYLGGLVLESASLGPEDEQDRAQVQQRNLRWAEQFDAAPDMAEVVRNWESEPLFATQRTIDEEDLKALRRVRLRSNKDKLVWILREAGAHTMPLAPQARASLAQFDFPVLYMAGEKDEKRTQEAQRLEALGAGNVHVATFNCGHNIHLEQPFAFTERLVGFVKELA